MAKWKNKNRNGKVETRSLEQLGNQPIGMVFRNLYRGDAGVPVTPETVEACSTVVACVRRICDDLGGLPVRVTRPLKSGRRERVSDHQVIWKLNHEPNEFHTSVTLRQLGIRSLLLYGNSYQRAKWSGSNLDAIYPHHPGSVRPIRIANGIRYEVRTPTETLDVGQREMLHVLNLPGTDGITGLSPIQSACNPIGISLAADTYAATFYGNGSAPGGIAKFPGELSPEAEAAVLATWENTHGGPANAHKTKLAFGEFEWIPLSVPPEQAQFLQSRQWQVVEICRLFGISPPMIGDLSKSSWSTYDAVSADHVKTALRPWMYRLEQEWTRKLLTEEEKRAGYTIEMDADGIMRGDRPSQDKSFATGIQFGWYSVNDVRDYLNLSPIDGGDVYLQPLNMAPATAKPEPEPEAETEKEPPSAPTEQVEEPANEAVEETRSIRAQVADDASRLNPLFHDAVRRCLQKETRAIERVIGKGDDVRSWAAGFYDKHESLVASSVLPCLTALDPATAEQRARNYAKRHVEKSVEDIEGAVAFDSLDALPNEWMNRRPFKLDLGGLL